MSKLTTTIEMGTYYLGMGEWSISALDENRKGWFSGNPPENWGPLAGFDIDDSTKLGGDYEIQISLTTASPEPIPEPSSILGLSSIALFGIRTAVKRKQFHPNKFSNIKIG